MDSLHLLGWRLKKASSSWGALSKDGKAIIQEKLIGMKRFDNNGRLNNISWLICVVLDKNDLVYQE